VRASDGDAGLAAADMRERAADERYQSFAEHADGANIDNTLETVDYQGWKL
jgi:hypothetical protein